MEKENVQVNLFGEKIEDIKEVEKEIKNLRKQIEYYNKRYHEEDNPEISDYAYDKLTYRLKKLEEEHPELVVASSPTQKIGGRGKNIFAKVEHEVQMQSLQDVFEYEEVESFVDKVIEEFGKGTKFLVQTKIDGLSVSLEYKNGVLVRGSTRGDGFVGEDVTQNIKMIKDIPQKLLSNDDVEIRGEVYLPRQEFDNIKTKMLKYIMYKKRTEKEVIQKFSSSVDQNLLEDVIEHLKEIGYINDESYIERAVNEFMAINTLSIREMKNKLYAKGISSDIIDWYFEKNEDEIVEYELRCAKKIILKKQPQMEREEIEQFLYRKGYSLEITKEAFEEV